MLYNINSSRRHTRQELNNTLGPKALQLAHTDIVKTIRTEKPTWTAIMAESVAWDIIRRIDWSNETLMHKGIEWITRQYLQVLCPKE